MYRIISVSTRQDIHKYLKTAVSGKEEEFRILAQFQNAIGALSIAPQLRPDIILFSEKSYFIGPEDFIRMLAEHGLTPVYIILTADSSYSSALYQNSLIYARVRETEITAGRMEELLHAAADEVLRRKETRRQSGFSPETQNPHIENALAYLQEHVTEPIPLTQLAEAIHVNPAYLSSLFRQETGKTFVQLRTELKIKMAQQLLRDGCRIGEAASLTGFEDEKYFSRMFRRFTGCSPREYQKGDHSDEKF